MRTQPASDADEASASPRRERRRAGAAGGRVELRGARLLGGARGHRHRDARAGGGPGEVVDADEGPDDVALGDEARPAALDEEVAAGNELRAGLADERRRV